MEWIKNLGIGAFLFFFVKGMLWLIVPYIIFRIKKYKDAKKLKTAENN